MATPPSRPPPPSTQKSQEMDAANNQDQPQPRSRTYSGDFGSSTEADSVSHEWRRSYTYSAPARTKSRSPSPAHPPPPPPPRPTHLVSLRRQVSPPPNLPAVSEGGGEEGGRGRGMVKVSSDSRPTRPSRPPPPNKAKSLPRGMNPTREMRSHANSGSSSPRCKSSENIHLPDPDGPKSPAHTAAVVTPEPGVEGRKEDALSGQVADAKDSAPKPLENGTQVVRETVATGSETHSSPSPSPSPTVTTSPTLSPTSPRTPGTQPVIPSRPYRPPRPFAPPSSSTSATSRTLPPQHSQSSSRSPKHKSRSHKSLHGDSRRKVPARIDTSHSHTMSHTGSTQGLQQSSTAREGAESHDQIAASHDSTSHDPSHDQTVHPLAVSHQSPTSTSHDQTVHPLAVSHQSPTSTSHDQTVHPLAVSHQSPTSTSHDQTVHPLAVSPSRVGNGKAEEVEGEAGEFKGDGEDTLSPLSSPKTLFDASSAPQETLPTSSSKLKGRRMFSSVRKGFSKMRLTNRRQSDQIDNKPKVFSVLESRAHSDPAMIVPGTPGESIYPDPLPQGVVDPLVVLCVAYLNRECVLREAGLFRIPGDHASIRKLRSDFIRGEPVDLMQVLDPHTVAGLMKCHFREWRFSIVPRGKPLIDITTAVREKDVDKAREVLNILPQNNIATLRMVAELLAKVVENSEWNMMTSGTLATSCGLSFFPYLPPNSANTLLKFMIDNCTTLFTE